MLTLRLGDHLGAAASSRVHLAGHAAGGGQGLFGTYTACFTGKKQQEMESKCKGTNSLIHYFAANEAEKLKSTAGKKKLQMLEAAKQLSDPKLQSVLATCIHRYQHRGCFRGLGTSRSRKQVMS